MNIEHVPDEGALIERTAELFATAMRQAVQDRGRFLVALSGGSTPKPAYERLAQPPYGVSLPWDSASIYFGDERMVPCDSDESNYKMACESLLNHIDIPAWNLHRIHGEDSVSEAARLYDVDLRALAEETGETIPRFDLMLLGLGPDGHTASLFPGTEVLENTRDLAAGVRLPDTSEGAQHATERVTMTYPVLNASRLILFAVAGADKAEALSRVEAGDISAPATRVRPTDGDLLWLVCNT
ncbi:MAG TPA: 6-phosphogluconolactonase [Chloroflexota bacterium]|jgi:6-phosphogluconolactonase|nr:6-phosphogluconolactonase [Chloroflexota bacterium]